MLHADSNTLRRLVYSLSVSLPLALSGCATLSEDECRNANWEVIGYSDATLGYRSGRVQDHAGACASLGVSVNLNEYLAGYDRGLPVYCTASTAYRVGETGASFPSQCDPSRYPTMLKAHQTGREAFLLLQEKHLILDQIQRKQKQIQALEQSIENQKKQLNDTKNSSGDRALTYREIDSLRSLLIDLYADERHLIKESQSLDDKRNRLANLY